MEAISKKTLSKILSLVLTAVLVFSLCVPFAAAGTDEKKKKDYDFDYTYLTNNGQAGEAGYIEVDGGDFIVNRNGMTSDIRFYGIEYDMSKNGIPTGEDLNTFLTDIISHGYNLIVLKDVYKVLKNSDNFEAFDNFLAATYKKSMYVGIEMFSKESLATTSGGLLYDKAALARAKTFFKKFLTRKNLARSDKDLNFYYYQDTTIAFIKLFDDFDISSDVSLFPSLKEPFNEWLAEKYGSREMLESRWLNSEGVTILGADENFTRKTVNVPTTPLNIVLNADVTGYQRQADFGAFLAAHTEKTLNSLIASIREYGYRSPVILSDNSSSAFNSRVSGCGDAAYGELNYTETMTLRDAMGLASRGAIGEKPYILKWNASVGNTNKISNLFNLASYSSYQDWDILITGEYSRFAEDITAVNNVKEIWDQTGLAAVFFRHRAIAPSFGLTFGVAYSDYDMTMDFGDYGYINNVSSMIAKTENLFYGENFTVNPHYDVVISAGNTSTGNFAGAASAKETGTKVIIQSLYPYQDATFFPQHMNKEFWYNDQGIISTKDRFVENIGNYDVYFGEGKAIFPEGHIESVEMLAKIFDRLNLTAYKNMNDKNDVACLSSSNLIVSDNSRLYYNNDTDSVVGFGSRFFMASGDLKNESLSNVYDAYLKRYYYDSTTEESERDIKVKVSDLSTDGTIAVYALGDGVNNENADEFIVYASSFDDKQKLKGIVTILRENTEIAAYGITPTGDKADNALKTKSKVIGGAGVMTVELDGNYDYYLIQLKEAEIDAALEGYDPNDSIPPRQNLFWYIVIPAIFFLVVVYSGILISDNLKVKRAERIRIATRKATLDKTGHYASALDVPDGEKSLRPDAQNAVSGRSRGTPGADIFEETEEEKYRRENPWEREDGTVDYTKIVRSDDEDENAW